MLRSQQRRTEGGIEYLSALMIIILCGILLLYSLSVKELRQFQISVKDNLDVACLSSALINREIYMDDETIVFDDSAYGIFLNNLKTNMMLDDNFYPVNECLYEKVNIHEFILYNVSNDALNIINYDNEGRVTRQTVDYTGNEVTPDGTLIQSSTIYADIGMMIRSFPGVEEYVHVTSSVDVIDH